MSDIDTQITIKIDYRDYCAYPDAKVTDLFLKYNLDATRPHSIRYNQLFKRYEITAYPTKA